MIDNILAAKLKELADDCEYYKINGEHDVDEDQMKRYGRDCCGSCGEWVH